MTGDEKGIGRTDEHTRASSVEDASGIVSEEIGEAAPKINPDAEWLSMATGDPALYLKDTE